MSVSNNPKHSSILSIDMIKSETLSLGQASDIVDFWHKPRVGSLVNQRIR